MEERQLDDYSPAEIAAEEERVRTTAWRGVCPWSGSRLIPRAVYDGPIDRKGDVMSCIVCDCFGFDREEVQRTSSRTRSEEEA